MAAKAKRPPQVTTKIAGSAKKAKTESNDLVFVDTESLAACRTTRAKPRFLIRCWIRSQVGTSGKAGTAIIVEIFLMHYAPPSLSCSFPPRPAPPPQHPELVRPCPPFESIQIRSTAPSPPFSAIGRQICRQRYALYWTRAAQA